MNTRTTLILSLCLAVAGLYLFFVAKPWESPTGTTVEKKPDAVTDVWPAKPKAEEIERVEVVLAKEPKRVFVKQDDKWLFVEPVKGIASKWQVDEFARKIVDLRSKRKYEKGDKARPSDEITELNKPAYTVTLTDKGGKTYTVKIGRREPTGGGTYVQLPDSDVVQVATDNLYATFDKRLSHMRDKKMAEYKVEEATRVKLEGLESCEVVKSGDQWMIESPVRARADKERVERIIRALANVYAQDFVEDKPTDLRQYSLDQPRLTATITFRHEIKKKEGETSPAETQPAETQPKFETKTLVMQFGGPADVQENNYFARLGGEDAVFSIAKTALTDTAAKVSELRDKQLARIDAGKVRKVQVIAASGVPMTLEKKNGMWVYADGMAAEGALVEDLIRAAGTLKAEQFSDDKLAVKAEKPRSTVTITQEGVQEPTVLKLLGQTPSQKNAYVQVGDQPGIAVVAEEAVAQFLAEPISYRKREMAIFPREQTSQVELMQDGQKLVLAKKDSQWQISSPVVTPADLDAVNDLLNSISVLRAQKVVAEGNAAAYGLDKPAVTLTATVQQLPPATAPAATQTASQPAVAASQPATAPAPKIYRLSFSKKDGKVYGMVEGSNLVYLVDPKVYDSLTAEMRQRSLMDFDVANVTGLSLAAAGAEIDLVSTDGVWSYKQDATVTMDDQKIKDQINVIRDLKTHRFVNYQAVEADMAKFKLDKPAARVVITSKSGTPVELRVSSEGPADDADKSKYATLIGSNRIFLLKGEQVDKLNKKLADFEKKAGQEPAQGEPPEGMGLTPGGMPGGGMPPGMAPGGAPGRAPRPQRVPPRPPPQ